MRRLICKPLVQAFGMLVITLFVVSSTRATTAIILSDEQLITTSRVILRGEVKSVKSQWDFSHDNIGTFVKVKVLAILKGQLANTEVVLKQRGGTVGDTSTVIFGTPDYKVGQNVLLFLDTGSDGTLRIAHLFQGKYDIVEDKATGQVRVWRRVDEGQVNILGPREAPGVTNEATLSKFTRKINRVLRTKAAEVSAYEAQREGAPVVEIPPEYIDNPAGEPIEEDLSAQYTFLGFFRWLSRIRYNP